MKTKEVYVDTDISTSSFKLGFFTSAPEGDLFHAPAVSSN